MKQEKDWIAMVRKDTDGELIICDVFIDNENFKFISKNGDKFVAPCKPLPLAKGRCTSECDDVSALYMLKMTEAAKKRQTEQVIARAEAFLAKLFQKQLVKN